VAFIIWIGTDIASQTLFSPHRNSLSGHLDLIRKTGCNILLHSSAFPVDHIVETHKLRSFIVPELDIVFDETSANPYPFLKTWEGAHNDPCMVIHISGSTSPPEPVVQPRSTLSGPDAHHILSPMDGQELIYTQVFGRAQRIFNALSIFHCVGLALGICHVVFAGKTVVYGPPGLISPKYLTRFSSMRTLTVQVAFPRPCNRSPKCRK